MLLDLYKKHQYESTLYKIQGVVMIMSAAGILFAAVLTAFLVLQPVSLYFFISVFACIAIAFLLQQFKVISRNTATIIYLSYICFVFTPANWIVTNGISGSTPFIAVIVMLALMMVLIGKTQKILNIAYLAGLIALVIFSIVSEPDPTRLSALIYKSSAFTVAIMLSVYYMIFMLKKYDQMHNQFLRGSIKDELTRVLSRGTLDVVVNHIESLYKSKQTDYIMIMIDVDNFKKLNDQYGHLVGDVVLRNTAKCIRDNTREEDFVIRYGGDEFLAVLMNASTEGAQMILNRIEEKQPCRKMLDFHITVSRGFAKRSECESPEDVIALADKRMYANKMKTK